MFPLHAVHFANWILDKPVFRVYNTYNFIYCSSAACSALKLAENSESGQNPERYRHCMRGGTARDESQSLGFFLRRQCGRLLIRESGDLLEQVTCAFCVIMEWTVCLLWKKRPWQRYAAMAFCFHRRFADCRLQTASVFLSAKGGSLCPGSRQPPSGTGRQRKKLQRLLDEEEII